MQLFTIVAAGLLLLFAFWKFGHKERRRGYRLPPGPQPWPLVGNLGLLGPLAHQDLKKLAESYGPILFLRLGSVNTVVVSSPGFAEKILRSKDQVFCGRPFSTHGDIVTYGNQNLVWSPHGPYWRHARKVFTLELFTTKRLRQFQKGRTEEVLNVLRSIIDGCKDGKAVRMDQKFSTLIINNVSRMALGKTFYGPNSTASTINESHVYEETYRELFRLATIFVAGDYFPFLRHFDFHGYKKLMRNAAKKSDEILEKIIEEHQQNRLNSHHGNGQDDEQDIVDALLTRPASDGENPLTRDQVKAMLQDVLMAGTDTSITTLGWALTELLRNPSTLRRAQEELDTVVGHDRLVRESDLPFLPFLRAIVKETFRLHPVVPLLVPHESLEDCVLDEYHIPKKSRVFVNTWAMGRNPTLWKNALEFNPERFLATDIDGNGLHFMFLPFGSGRRICPGKNLAMVMVEYSLAAMLHSCQWELPAGIRPEDMDMEEAPGLTVPKAIPLEAIASPRLPLSVIFSSQ